MRYVTTALWMTTLLALANSVPAAKPDEREDEVHQENVLDSMVISPWKLSPLHHGYENKDVSLGERVETSDLVYTPGPLHHPQQQLHTLQKTLWLPGPRFALDYTYQHHNHHQQEMQHPQGYGELHRTRYSTEDDGQPEPESDEEPKDDPWDESLVPTASSDISSWESSEEGDADEDGDEGEEDEEEEVDDGKESKLEQSSSSSSSSSSSPSSSSEENGATVESDVESTTTSSSSSSTSVRTRSGHSRAQRLRLSEWFDWHMSNCHSSEASNRSCRWVCTDRKRNPWGFGCCRCRPITTTTTTTTTTTRAPEFVPAHPSGGPLLFMQPFLLPLVPLPPSPADSQHHVNNNVPITMNGPSLDRFDRNPSDGLSAEKSSVHDEFRLFLRPDKLSQIAEDNVNFNLLNMMHPHGNLLQEQKRRRRRR